MFERRPGSRRRRAATPKLGTTNDINPQDVANLRQGGNLRLALTDVPSNFNRCTSTATPAMSARSPGPRCRARS